MTQEKRETQEVLSAQLASDGAGVRLKRVFGDRDLDRFDPFLVPDELDSSDSVDFIGGFPSHPHSGFETGTCMEF